jgi:hypothetical protein
MIFARAFLSSSSIGKAWSLVYLSASISPLKPCPLHPLQSVSFYPHFHLVPTTAQTFFLLEQNLPPSLNVPPSPLICPSTFYCPCPPLNFSQDTSMETTLRLSSLLRSSLTIMVECMNDTLSGNRVTQKEDSNKYVFIQNNEIHVAKF